MVATGEQSQTTWDEPFATGKRLADMLGRDTSVERLLPDDFAVLRTELAKNWGLRTLSNEIGRMRAYFNYGCIAGLLDAPVKFVMAFDKPSKNALKREALSKPAKIFERDEIKAVYAVANPTMRAFILLGLNGGMGGSDIGLLEPRHVKNGWIKFPRPKTMVEREFPLWPETIEAMEAAKQTKGELSYYFVTKRGLCRAKGNSDSPVSSEFRKLCLAAECHAKGRGFYALRH